MKLRAETQRNGSAGLYRLVRILCNGSSPNVGSVKGPNGEVVSDIQGLLQVWTEHFVRAFAGSSEPMCSLVNRWQAASIREGVAMEPAKLEHKTVGELVRASPRNKGMGLDSLASHVHQIAPEHVGMHLAFLLDRAATIRHAPVA